MIYDDIFFINSALNAPRSLSVFTDQERFDHMVETIDSIHAYAPNSKIYIFDCSVNFPDWQASKLKDVTLKYFGDIEDVKSFSTLGLRSIAETMAFMRFLDWFHTEQMDNISKRIVKLSGRYTLTEDFVPYSDEMKNAFVFAKSENSWMGKSKQERAGVNKLYKLRQWQMGYSMLPVIMNKLPHILIDCMTHGIDIEHAYYKHLHTEKVIELEKIGVSGFIATNGEYINE